jgi:hypothetical protein
MTVGLEDQAQPVQAIGERLTTYDWFRNFGQHPMHDQPRRVGGAGCPFPSANRWLA